MIDNTLVATLDIEHIQINSIKITEKEEKAAAVKILNSRLSIFLRQQQSNVVILSIAATLPYRSSDLCALLDKNKNVLHSRRKNETLRLQKKREIKNETVKNVLIVSHHYHHIKISRSQLVDHTFNFLTLLLLLLKRNTQLLRVNNFSAQLVEDGDHFGIRMRDDG